MKPIEELLIQYNGKGSPLTVQGITTGFKKSQPSIKIASSRGTLDTPEVVQNGDQLGVLKFTAYTGHGTEPFVNAAFISAFVSDSNLYPNKELVDATLMLGSIKGVFTGKYVTIDHNGVLSAPKIVLNFNDNPVANRDTSKDWWQAGGTNFEYDVPLTINTKSTGIRIAQTGNFKQPAFSLDSYDDNAFKAGWTSYNRYRGTPDNPKPLQNGDFIYAFDWMGKSAHEDPWEWGMAQTAIVDADPVRGFLPVSMNWVTRDTPFSEPKVRVKIASNGKLFAHNGLVVDESFFLNLEEVHHSNVDTNSVKYLKVVVNGVECALALHPLISG